MPNHITNCLEISHDDAEKIKWLSEVVVHKNEDDEEIFDFAKIIPPPEDMFKGNLGNEERKMCEEKGIANWYDWNCENWGTKWNAYSFQWHHKDKNKVAIEFETAWAPPEPIIEKLDEMGFKIRGIWKDEGDNEYHCFNEDSGDWSVRMEFEYYGF